MTPDFLPLRLLLATFAGWVTRDQAQVIAYLVEENRVLKDQLKGRQSSWFGDSNSADVSHVV